jgi:hypothetical protein
MEAMKRFMSRFSIIGEFARFFWERKLWWMVPMMLVLLALGLLIVFAQSSSVVPFIYVLF